VKAYLVRRLLLIIPTFLGISIITFALLQLSPGNPAFMRLQQMRGVGSENISPDIIEQTKKMYGLDKPLPMRYVIWMGKMVRLDFGNSYGDGRPVLTRIREALPVTLQINFISILLMYLISIPVGVFSATHSGTRTDGFITVFLFILYSLPSFWVAMLLMFFLGGGGGSDMLNGLVTRAFEGMGIVDWKASQWLLTHVFEFNWFPIYGISSDGASDWPFLQWLWDRTWHLILPVFCLTYASFAILSRYARSGLIEVIRQDYIRTARAYGFSERTVVYRYGLRNSLIPIITLLGSILPGLIGGSVIIESIFSVPGMGRLFYTSILSRDYPLVMGIFTFTAILTMLGLILSDILYALVDPRIKFD
jgi:peptide/nickel transport system permease protein